MTDTNQLPVMIVQGSNWRAEVRLSEDDFLDENNKERPAWELGAEAAALAIERIFPLWRPEPEDNTVNRQFGVENGVEFELLDNDAPSVGPFLIIFPKGTDENSNATQYLPSYWAFASGGYYEMAKDLEKEYLKYEELAEAAMRDINKDNSNNSKSKKKSKDKPKLSKKPKKPKK
jgi:hypothetical protein